MPVEVTVYVVKVTKVARKWAEQPVRRRAWLGLDDAVALIDEPELAAMVAGADFPSLLRAEEPA